MPGRPHDPAAQAASSSVYAVAEGDRPQALTALLALGFAFEEPRPLHREVLDSFDGRLHRSGLRLEHVTGERPVCVVRGVGAEDLVLPVRRPPKGSQDLPAGPLRARLRSVLGPRALLPCLAVTDRQQVGAWRDGTGKTIARVVFHDLGDARLPELLEVRPMVGYRKAAKAIGAVVDRLGWKRLAGDEIEAYASVHGIGLAGFSAEPTVRLQRSQDAAGGVCAVLAQLAATIDANWQGTVERIDPEFLHDLRVAVRRSRSVLAEGGSALPAHTVEIARRHLGRLQAITGPVRDLDVYLLEWSDYLAAVPDELRPALTPVQAELERRADAAHLRLREQLDSPGLRSTFGQWRALLDGAADIGISAAAAAPAGRNADQPLGPFVRRRIERSHRRLVEHGHRIGPQSPPSQLHELRKDAKRLRYLVECFGSLLGGPRRRLFLQHLKPLQEVLGTFQDAEVHAAFLRGLAAELAPGVATDEAVRVLAAALDARQAEARAAFSARFEAFTEPGTARALRRAISGVGS